MAAPKFFDFFSVIISLKAFSQQQNSELIEMN